MNKNKSYRIQPGTSKIQFRINTPIGEVVARFQEFSGHLLVMRSGENKGVASIDIGVGSLDADRKLICLMLRGEKFFDVENFPSMNFIGSSFEWVNDDQAILIGDMTIRDVTRKVIFYVDLKKSESKKSKSYSLEHITISASASIRCSDFGLQRLATVVSDTMGLNVEIDALKVDVITAIADLD